MEAQLWEVGEINAKYTSNPKPDFKNQSHIKATGVLEQELTQHVYIKSKTDKPKPHQSQRSVGEGSDGGTKFTPKITQHQGSI